MKLDWRPVSLGGPTISTSLTGPETEELRRLAPDSFILEVGSAYGYSAVAMALAGGRVVAVDRHFDLNSYDAMVANLNTYAVADKVEIRCGDSQTVLPQLFGTHAGLFDVAWIDGGHEADICAHDVEWARRLLGPSGTLVVHDYDEDTCPGVRQALDAWKVPPRLVDTMAIYGPGEW